MYKFEQQGKYQLKDRQHVQLKKLKIEELLNLIVICCWLCKQVGQTNTSTRTSTNAPPQTSPSNKHFKTSAPPTVTSHSRSLQFNSIEWKEEEDEEEEVGRTQTPSTRNCWDLECSANANRKQKYSIDKVMNCNELQSQDKGITLRIKRYQIGQGQRWPRIRCTIYIWY